MNASMTRGWVPPAPYQPCIPMRDGVWADAGDWMSGPDPDKPGRWMPLQGVPVTREGFKTAARRVLALAVCDGGLWGLAA